ENRLAHHPSRWGELVGARIEALLAPPEQADAAFSRAVAVFASDEQPFERGRSLLALARHHAAVGRAAEAHRARAAALEAFETAGALSWAAACSAAGPTLSTVPGDGTPSVHLTTEQREIVRLVRTGARNREIAA